MPRIKKKPEQRRQELLDIGFRLYMEKGMAGLSIKEIAGKVNVAVGLFYYYFKSKEAFVAEAMKNFVNKKLEPVYDALEKAGSAQQKLDDVLEKFLLCVKQIRSRNTPVAFQNEQNRAFTEQLLQQLLPKVEKFIADGSREGVFCVTDPKMTAEYVLYGLCGVLNAGEDSDSKSIKRVVYASLGVAG